MANNKEAGIFGRIGNSYQIRRALNKMKDKLPEDKFDDMFGEVEDIAARAEQTQDYRAQRDFMGGVLGAVGLKEGWDMWKGSSVEDTSEKDLQKLASNWAPFALGATAGGAGIWAANEFGMEDVLGGPTDADKMRQLARQRLRRRQMMRQQI